MRVKLPDGKIANFPDDMPPQEIEAVLQKQYAKPAKAVGFDPATVNPIEGMSTGSKVAAGAGKAVSDLGLGAQQAIHDIAEMPLKLEHPLIAAQKLGSRALSNFLPDKEVLAQEAATRQKEDAPLMSTGAGITGNILGNVALAAPLGAGYIPAAVGGAGFGAMQPTAPGQSRALNTATGAIGGIGGQAIGSAIPAVAGAVKNYISPLTESGQNKILASVLRRFGATPDDFSRAMPDVEGYKPTLAEVAQKPGISGLQTALKNMNPEAKNALQLQEVSNNAAILKPIMDIAGDTGSLQAAKAARSEATQPLYDAAKMAQVVPDEKLMNLLNRPSAKQAFERAQRLAQEAGDTLSDKISGKELHYLKMGMDDLLSDASSGMGATEAAAIRKTRNAITDWIGEKIPEYDTARKLSAEMAKPINQMQVGQALYDKIAPALTNPDIPTRIRAESFAKALRDSDQLVKNATEFGGATLENTMTPAQIQKLNALKEILSLRASADDMAKTVGSNTAQNIASQNLIRSFASDIGLPQMGESELASNLTKGIMSPHRLLGTEQRLTEKLAQVMADPQQAQQILQSLPPEQASILAEIIRRSGAPLGSAINMTQSQQ